MNSFLLTTTLMNEWKEKTYSMAALLAKEFAQPIFELDIHEMKYLAKLVTEGDGFRYIYVQDEKGRVLVDTTEGSQLLGEVLNDTLTRKALAVNRILMQKQADIVDVAAPVMVGTRHLGIVRIGFSTERIREVTGIATQKIGDSINQAFAIIVRDIFLFLPAVFVPTATLGYIFIRSLISPIKNLTAGTERITRGDLTCRVEIKSKDELGQLAASFNKMTENLHETTVSKNYVDNIIRSIADTLIVVTPEATIKMVNQATCNLLDYQENELIGKPISLILAEEQHVKTILFDALSERGFICNVETVYVANGGRKIPMLLSGAAMNGDNTTQGIVVVGSDLTERKRIEKEIRNRAIQQEVVSKIGQRALAGIDLTTLLDEIVAMVAQTFSVEYSKILELLPDGKALLLRAGIGWKEGLVGQATVNAGYNSQAGYTILSGEPVIVGDLNLETRFNGPDMIFDHGVISGMSVIIQGKDRPFGVLGVHTTRQRTFTIDDVHFLQAIANVLAHAIERNQFIEKLGEKEERLELALWGTDLGLWDWNIQTGKVFYDKRLAEMLDYTLEEIELHGDSWEKLIHPDDMPGMTKILNDHLNGKIECYEANYRILNKSGEWLWILDRGKVVERDRYGKPLRVVGTHRNITTQKRAEARILYMANHDILTDLPNRALFLDRLEQELAHAHRNNRILAVIFLDLDRFKIINDTHGHAVGDLLLKAVAERLRGCIREGDTVSRMGGDEFTLIITDIVHPQDVVPIAQKIHSKVSLPFHLEGRELHITPSMGITLYPLDAKDADSLIKKADTAMYHSKEQGRGNFKFYTEEMNVTILERAALENNLRKAPEKEELVVYYQPQINLVTGQVIGIEALVRWQHPHLGMISPGKFIPIAEEAGLIVPLGEWVLKTACSQIKKWHDAGFSTLRLAVNISAYQFKQQNFVDMITRVLKETSLGPHSLEIELTEGVIMQINEQIITTLYKLKAVGIQFTIDDFGTGYSSLGYLKRFPVDALKIDQSFIQDITTNPDDVAIVKAIIAIAESLKLRVIAEGVETHEQVAVLQKLCCNNIQGYVYSRPLPAPDLEHLLRKAYCMEYQK
ncbi:MAG: diguanylate cyclase/phosphodiesterase [Candidatus Brocadia sinica]|nr:MAG: diguanylate cyclase/phosphodiesterase [Candidatus Brocadia sinica]